MNMQREAAFRTYSLSGSNCVKVSRHEAMNSGKSLLTLKPGSIARTWRSLRGRPPSPGSKVGVKRVNDIDIENKFGTGSKGRARFTTN